MKRCAVQLVFTFVTLLSMTLTAGVCGQRRVPRAARQDKRSSTRLAQLIEANIIAVHAYQVLLAKGSGKGDVNCYSPGKLTDAELKSLSEHQRRLLNGTQDPPANAGGTGPLFNCSQL